MRAGWSAVPASDVRVRASERSSGDGTTHLISGSYRYVVRGQSFTGHQIGIVDEGGMGVEFRRRERELLRLQDTGEQIIAYVNPDDPSDAVLYTGIVWDYLFFFLIFAVVFGGVGFGGLSLLYISSKRTKKKLALKHRFPDKPWYWKEDWRAGSVPCSTKAGAIGTWVFAIFWNLISCPVLFAVPSELEKGNHLILIGLLFPLIGAGLLAAATYQTVRWYKYGRSKLTLDTLPGVVGGNVTGTIQLNSRITATGPITLQLVNVHRVRTDSGKNRRTERRLLWEDSYSPDPKSYSANSLKSIPVSFTVPFSCRETDSEDNVSWEVIADVPTPGVDLSATFEVPVFRTAQSNKSITERTRPKRDSIATAIGNREYLARKGITLHETRNDGIALHIPPPIIRRTGSSLALIAFTVVWTGIVAGLIVAKDVPRMFPFVFGFFDVFMILASANSLISARAIEANSSGICWRNPLFPFTGTKSFPASTITEISYKSTGTETVGNTQRRIYKVQVMLQDGSKKTVASNLADKGLVSAISEELRKAIKGELDQKREIESSSLSSVFKG
jgi:hypothetical protein